MNRLLLLFSVFLAITSPISACSAQETSAGSRESFVQGSAAATSGVKIGKIVRDCAECPEMVAVPQVGHTASSPGRIFYAGRFEVTWREYLVAVREKACPVPEKSFGGFYDPNDPRINDNYPLTGISPDGFPCYLQWLKRKTGKTYRIPSAPEWEHVARAGTVTEYYWGDGLGYNNAIVFDYFDLPALKRRMGYPQDQFDKSLHDPRGDVNFDRLFPVGQFKPNPWGLYDVIGNAAEVTTEVSPPVPGCLERRSPMICEQLSARGADRIRSPNPMKPNPPITQSWTTTRFRTSAHGGNHRTGFRLVRD